MDSLGMTITITLAVIVALIQWLPVWVAKERFRAWQTSREVMLKQVYDIERR
jgi:hypothetical protein